MRKENPLEILKEAILLERRGHAFYQKMADFARNNNVREFFQLMADEELRHKSILEQQYKVYTKKKRFADLGAQYGDDPTLADIIMSDALKEKISAAGFEAAAIAAAMYMEELTISLYADRAVTAQDPNEKELYRWLVDWEHSHLLFLAKLNKEIREAIWEDNHFWPM